MVSLHSDQHSIEEEDGKRHYSDGIMTITVIEMHIKVCPSRWFLFFYFSLVENRSQTFFNTRQK